jgi:hypothetical protein
MKFVIACLLAGASSLAFTGMANAHGDQPHPKCKKGYVLNDQHKCVRK